MLSRRSDSKELEKMNIKVSGRTRERKKIMRMKIAEIIIEGAGEGIMDLERRIVSELESGEGREKYETHVKQYRSKRGFVTKGKIKVFVEN